MVNEGYTQEYEPFGDEGRELQLKTGQWVKVHEIPDFFKSQDAIDCIRLFRRFQHLGLPFGAWGNNPNKLVEAVDVLQGIEDFYHPRLM